MGRDIDRPRPRVAGGHQASPAELVEYWRATSQTRAYVPVVNQVLAVCAGELEAALLAAQDPQAYDVLLAREDPRAHALLHRQAGP